MKMPAQSKQRAYAETRAVDHAALEIMTVEGCSFSEAWLKALQAYAESVQAEARMRQADKRSTDTLLSAVDGQDV